MAESQEAYEYSETVGMFPKERWIEFGLSSERLGPYLTRAAGNYSRAYNLYLFNARLSKAFLFPLHVLEVTLRNRIKSVLASVYGHDWHLTPDYRSLLSSDGLDSLNKAENLAGSTDVNDVVANTTFDFWKFFLSRQYDSFWRMHISTLVGNKNTRGGLYELIKKINDFRNRIAHHEPILDKDYMARYRDIIEALGCLNSEVQEWAKAHSTVDLVRLTEPAPTGNPKPLLKDKADVNLTVINSSEKLINLPLNNYLYCEDEGLVFDRKEIAKYLLKQVDSSDNSLVLDMNGESVADVIRANKIKKNVAIFSEDESYQHSKVMFRGKTKYILVMKTNGDVKGVIEKPHRH
ncbi:Abi family protein [Vibrio sp. F13]|uniref:Abi family protein n=1 Tax=Vibrio sp. F13 TaxID=2070777 RepID=UPI0010BD28E6|nr:Abi family protein [Vibrio sp. F13]TKG11705.1 Abi family protein [Vibrio sp. F13]